MKKRIAFFVFFGVISFSFLLLFFNMQVLNIYNLPDQIPMTYSDVETINKDKSFGNNITANIEEKTVNVGGEKISFKTLIFKLFGFIPIRRIEANIIDEKEVYIGGCPIGFSIDVDGLIVIGSNSILTEQGPVDTVENSEIKKGDIITSINGKKTSSINDLYNILNSKNYNGEELTLEILRKNETSFRTGCKMPAKPHKYPGTCIPRPKLPTESPAAKPTAPPEPRNSSSRR